MTPGARWPAFITPMPPAKSMKRLASTSSRIAPSARAAKICVAWATPRATADLRRRASSRDLGPGIAVRNWIVGMSVPSDWRFVEIDVDLFRFEIFLDAPGAELAAKAGLFVTAPGGFDVSRLHVIDPDDSGAKCLHHAKSFEDVARPNGGGEAVGSGIGNADGIGFVFEGDNRGDGAEDFFLGDASGIVHVVENCGLDVKTFGECSGAASAGGELGFFFAEFLIFADAIELFFADERAHFGFAVERRAEADCFCLGGHGFDKFCVERLLDEDA